MQVDTIEIKRSKGHMVVNGTGRTPRGTKYIKVQKILKATSGKSPGYKAELQTALDEIFGKTA